MFKRHSSPSSNTPTTSASSDSFFLTDAVRSHDATFRPVEGYTFVSQLIPDRSEPLTSMIVQLHRRKIVDFFDHLLLTLTREDPCALVDVYYEDSDTQNEWKATKIDTSVLRSRLTEAPLEEALLHHGHMEFCVAHNDTEEIRLTKAKCFEIYAEYFESYIQLAKDCDVPYYLHIRRIDSASPTYHSVAAYHRRFLQLMHSFHADRDDDEDDWPAA